MKVAAVDLFCGAGGLSYGLQQAGVSVVAGIDQDPDCKYPYEQNINGEYVRADVHALAQNPDNLLARSYMGQGLVLEGDWVGAKRQYDEIIARGGRGTWAEASLRDAITTGTTYTY